MQKVIQKFLLTITLAVFLITSLALSPEPALAGSAVSTIKTTVNKAKQKLKRKNKVDRDIGGEARQFNREMLRLEQQQRNNSQSSSGNRRSGNRRSHRSR